MTKENDALISIQNVDKWFGKVQAVNDVSMNIRRGEFFSLLGASGCGKTTLLRMLAGFEAASAGRILINGQEMAEVPPHDRPVNMVFQNYAIFPHLNVRDNIAYGLRKRKLPRVKRYNMVDEMLDLIKLPGYGLRRANELSGGQRQRVALARALIMKPMALLLDEPLGALDKQLREQMQIELRALQRSVGITFVLVTHDQEEALTLSDQIAVMSAGKVLQIATPERLYDTPKSRAVASFIGNMNFFEGLVSNSRGSALELDTEGLGPIQVNSNSMRHERGSRVLIAIRPERLMLSLDKPSGAHGKVPGIVESIVYLGVHRNFIVKISGKEKPIAVSMHNEGSLCTQGIQQGSHVWISWNDTAFVVLEDA